jgi:DNA processing protein
VSAAAESGARSASDDERLARLALSLVREPGDLWLTTSVAEVGGAVLRDHLLEERHLRGNLREVALRLAEVDAPRELARANRLGLRFVVPGDDEWPVQLEDLEHAEALDAMGGTPVGLWARGPVRLDEIARSVAVVGSRSATTYGADVAAEIAAATAREQWVVVSGGAFGIDVAAHRGALGGGGITVAVLACGADRVYPQAHAQILEHIGEHGVVVSESPPGHAPFKGRFLSRNRLIAALTRGTVVVEAARRSGALNTATWAARLNRPLMGVPGPVTSAPSEGVHRLLRSGQATVVTGGHDVLEVVGGMGEHLVSELRGPERPHDRLTPRQRQVLEAVPVHRPVPADSISRTAGVRLEHTLEALVELDRQALVVRAGRGWRLARRPGEVVEDA